MPLSASKKLQSLKPAPQLGRGVLIVEDDPDLQWNLARTLTVQGHRVVGTSSGEGALALLTQWGVDMAVINEDLPGMKGMEVIEKVRELCPGLPVVLMTQTGELPAVSGAASTTEAPRCIKKPFTPSELVALLNEIDIRPVAI